MPLKMPLELVRYKYIHFRQIATQNGRWIWSCRNNRTDSELGQVMFYGPWRQYCYFPKGDTVLNKTCLDNIAEFLQKVTVDSTP